MPSLILIKSPTGAGNPQTYLLNFAGKSEIAIGRDKAKCEIFIDDGEQQVSRKQAFISTADGKFYLNHSGRNPTLLNSRSLDTPAPQLLKQDDRIKVCDFLFRFHDERTAASSLPTEFLNALPDPGEADGEMTTVHHSVNKAAAQQFLDVQPVEQVRLLLNISTALSRTLDLDTLLEQIAESLFGVFRQADRCFVIQLDDAGRIYPKVIKARRANTGDRYSRTIIQRCIETNQAYLSEDASADAALGAAQSIADFRIRSVMCVPLATSEGKPLGAIQLDTQDISKKFRDEDLKLLTIVSNLASVAVEKAQFHTMLLLREKAQREIELAKTVQLGFLPQGPPDVPGYEFFGFYSAAQTVGGDYYDYIQLPTGKLAVVLGDVAGKGVPAAMLMAKLSAEVRFAFMIEPNPAKSMRILNAQLVRGGIGDRFVTLVALILEPSTGKVVIVNAGHQTPILYCTKDRKFDNCVVDTSIGLPLGIMDDYEYESDEITLADHQTLLVFTDGVTDAATPAGTMFQMTGVEAVLRSDAALGEDCRPRAVGERLADTVRKHANGAPQSDDIAIVSFGRYLDLEKAVASTRATPTLS